MDGVAALLEGRGRGRARAGPSRADGARARRRAPARRGRRGARATRAPAAAGAAGARPPATASAPIRSRTATAARASVVRRGSRTPARYPTRPPSIFAAAVAGNGVPVVARLKATQGARNPATGSPHASARRPVSGPASQKSGSSRTASGRASAASPSARRPPRRGRARGARGGRHQQRGERDLHAGERAPHHRPGQRHEHGGEEGGVVTAGPDQGEAAGQPRGPERGGDPQRLRQDRVAPEHRERPAERERPERRGRARHRHARVIGEPAALGQIPRELHVDPRVVEGEGVHAEHARELPRPQQEEPDRRASATAGAATASVRPLTGRRARKCSRRTRRVCG